MTRAYKEALPRGPEHLAIVLPLTQLTSTDEMIGSRWVSRSYALKHSTAEFSFRRVARAATFSSLSSGVRLSSQRGILSPAVP